MLDAGFGTLQTLKSRLLPSAVEWEMTWDAPLAALGKAVAARMNAHCNRRFERTVGQVDEFNAATRTVILRACPVETITTLQLRVFTGTLENLTAGYQLDKSAGLMQFASTPGDGTERIVATYTGGYWLDNGGTMPAGATPLPDDVLEAWIIQCQAWAEARRILGEVALQSLAPKAERPSSLTLTSDVQAILEPYRRYATE